MVVNLTVPERFVEKILMMVVEEHAHVKKVEYVKKMENVATRLATVYLAGKINAVPARVNVMLFPTENATMKARDVAMHRIVIMYIVVQTDVVELVIVYPVLVVAHRGYVLLQEYQVGLIIF